VRAVEVEGWARRLIEVVQSGGSHEDSRVEFKAEWPSDPNKCARRIAGHCNAARGDLVLWLIGVDEGAGQVIGVQAEDLATWWPKVRAEFDGDMPDLQEHALDVDGLTVVALLFETDRAPFVVRNAAHGIAGGGPVQREVPWREGTAVRSATRAELLKLLLPLQTMPTLEVTSAVAHLHPLDGATVAWSVEVTVYATLPINPGLVLPNHRSTATLAVPVVGYVTELDVGLRAGSFEYGRGLRVPDGGVHTVHQGDDQVIIEGPGFFRVLMSKAVERPPVVDLLFEPLVVSVRLRPAGTDLVIPFSVTLPPDARDVEDAENYRRALIRWEDREGGGR
jgi:hypothetical protein